MRVLQFAAVAIVGNLSPSVQAAEPETEAVSARGSELETAADALDALADEESESSDTLFGSEPASNLWKPDTNNQLLDEFLEDARRLNGRGWPSRQAIAAKYGLSMVGLDEAVSLLRDMEKYGYDDGRKGALRNRALRLIEAGNRAPIALMLAAAAVGHLADDDCGAADVGSLMQGSRNAEADLWAIATSCSSSSAFAIAIDKSVAARPALSYLAMNWTNGDPASELAATDMLLRPDFLMQVDRQQRETVHADVARFKLAKLLDLGLLDEALAFGDSLSPSVRRLALKPERADIRTVIGGFRLKTSPFHEAVAADYAAALALAGRNAEARSVLDLIAPAAKRREARICLDAASDRCGVSDNSGIPLGALIVDQLLDQPNADPYVLIESGAEEYSGSRGGVTEALCRLLSQPGEEHECRIAREITAGNRAEKGAEEEGERAFWHAIGRAGGQPFERAQSGYAAKLVSLGLGEASPDTGRSRASVNPEPVPFRELPLPAGATPNAPRPSIDPKALAPLPDGYRLVRVDRSGRRTAAISLSQRFDPNGEVTAGGYWLHLSEDGGRSWQPPLYTGLAEHFPYVVPERSRLPLLAGDKVQLEVEEALIDTASISYPPVGTRLKSKRQGIYLDIRIADLRKDSDGDGLSDIAARHLLLDRCPTSGTPFIVGPERNCPAPRADTLARLEILKKLFKIEAHALIEGVGPKEEAFGSWRQSNPIDKPPIFLRGDPVDYRCVAPDRLMIVYSDADRERLRKFSPDFQLIELPPIRWNRDRNRGFVRWSMGWAGGTYRLISEGQSWKLESLGEWMT